MKIDRYLYLKPFAKEDFSFQCPYCSKALNGYVMPVVIKTS